MKLKFIFFVLFLGGNILAQDNCSNIPVQNIEVINAQGVRKDGKLIQKNQKIRIQKEIPLFRNADFYRCNGLTFEEGGKLTIKDADS